MPDGDKVPRSESVERPWASNDKVQFDNMISHTKRVDVLAETAVANAIAFSEKSNNAYLERAKQMADAYMEQANAQNKEALGFVEKLHEQYAENNRFTLDRLYSVFPEEAVGIGTLLKAFESYLKESGWTSPQG